MIVSSPKTGGVIFLGNACKTLQFSMLVYCSFRNSETISIQTTNFAYLISSL